MDKIKALQIALRLNTINKYIENCVNFKHKLKKIICCFYLEIVLKRVYHINLREKLLDKKRCSRYLTA